LENICLVNAGKQTVLTAFSEMHIGGTWMMTLRRKPKESPGKLHSGVPRFQMDLHFASGYKARVADVLQSNESTRKFFSLIESDRDRDALVVLLNVVFWRAQQNIKTDSATEANRW
jgi:hypothetical protein